MIDLKSQRSYTSDPTSHLQASSVDPGVRTTQRKGDQATAQAIATFTSMGFDVSIPLTESAAYDLVVDENGALRRVQCKFSSSRDVDLRRIHSNGTGFVTKRVPPDAYDWLYVLRPDGMEFLLKECYSGRRAVTPQAEHELTREA
jgi:hypothetical protein